MIISVDTETRGFDTRKFVCGCIAYEDGSVDTYFTRTEMYNKIINIIESNGKRGHNTYIYGHFHEYDFYTYARDHWQDEGFEYLNFNPFIVIYRGSPDMRKRKKYGYFLDSYSLFRMPLEQLGNYIGMPKGETHVKLTEDMSKITEEEMKDIVEYCKNDTLIVINAILNLREKLEVLGYKPRKILTSGQVAMSTFISHLRRENLWWKLTNPGERGNIIKTEYDHEIRTSFRGGRNEAFQLGEFENVTGVDINSLYPFIMREMPFPDLSSETLIRDPLRKLKISDIETRLGFVCAEMEIPEGLEYGYLPIRYKKHLVFPVKPGLRLKSWWTVNEFSEAKELGYKIKQIEYAILYETSENIFRKYINDLYLERVKSDQAMQLVIKMIMNSLFGKFGQKAGKKTIKFIYRSDVSEYCNEDTWEIEGDMGSKYAISKVDMGEERYFVNPAIPSMITSYARDYLFKHMRAVDTDDLIYTDTDSLMIKNFSRYKKLFDIGKEIGQWKVIFDKQGVNIKGEKKYRVADKVKVSGITRRFLNPEDFEKGVMFNQRMTTMKQGIKGFGEIGTFSDITQKVNPGCKKDIEIMEMIVDDRKEKESKKG